MGVPLERYMGFMGSVVMEKLGTLAIGGNEFSGTRIYGHGEWSDSYGE